MTKIRKLNRNIKIYKYSIGCIILISIIPTMLVFNKTNNTVESTIERLIAKGLIFSMILILDLSLIFLYKVIKKICEDKIEEEIENVSLKETIPQEYALTTDSFVEVDLKDKENKNFFKMLVISKLEAKYYAKLVSKDEIEVILQDKDGDVIEEPKRIRDFQYFKDNYKPL